MKFSFKFEITDNRRESEGAERTGTGSRILGELAKGAGAAKDALKKHLPKLGRLADSISDEIKTDVAAVRDRDPAARNDVEVLLLYSGVHAILAYRVAHKLYLGKKYFSARAVSQLAKFITGIEIHPGAKIGKGLVIDHGTGVVIGETAEIGDNCTLYQGVTLGGTGKDTGKRHPTLGNNVMIGAGAKVLGPFRIGDNAKIAAGAVVLEEIPANATAVGIPARVVRRDGVRVTGCNEELDQVHLPDPVAQQFCRLETRTEKLEAELEALRAAMKKEADGSAGTPPTGDQ
ncbi:serine acetyltransferase [Anaerotruncus sp. CAG:390]|nr:serine acetyltransferase [Anaerotruncus sp. CAG:390]